MIFWCTSQAWLADASAASVPECCAARERTSRYEARLEFETNTIIKMGFPGYFLIVADFIQWAKNNGVPVGPGSWFRCWFSGCLLSVDY
jgi:DNA polymerase-3 subunit alpha